MNGPGYVFINTLFCFEKRNVADYFKLKGRAETLKNRSRFFILLQSKGELWMWRKTPVIIIQRNSEMNVFTNAPG